MFAVHFVRWPSFQQRKPYSVTIGAFFAHWRGHLSSIEITHHLFIFTCIFRHHFDNLRTRGPQFCLWLMWPQPIVIAVDCNFPHFWFSQCWDVFCQLHSIGYRNQLLVATLSFHVGSLLYHMFTCFQEIHGESEVYKDHMFPTGWCVLIDGS